MGMVVRTNTMAMNANRQLGVNSTQVSKSLEKLSSGFKINRASDDASGLAISEKMKAQIKGLETASANSQDGISLIQTAEGGAQEIHDMLNRMTELATKSANGTIQNEVDREAIQREVDDLNNEITRIAKSTNFNGINLLDGNLSGGEVAGSTGTNPAGNVLVAGAGTLDDIGATKGKYSTVLGGGTAANLAIAKGGTVVDIDLEMADGTSKRFSFTAGTDATTAAGTKQLMEDAFSKDAYLSENYTLSLDDATGELTIEAKKEGTSTPAVEGVRIGGYVPSVAGAFAGAITASSSNIYTYTATADTAGGDMSNATDVAVAAVKVNTATAAKDAYKQINLGADGTDLTNKTLKVGDKTYKFVNAADQYEVTEGETAVVMGKNRNETTAALVAALKKDGVSSAQVDGIHIMVGNTDELKSKQGYAMSTTSVGGVKIGGGVNVDGQQKVAVTGTAGAGGPNQITINYENKDGKAQSVKVGVTLAAGDSVDVVREKIAKAINEDDVLKDIFEVSVADSGGADAGSLIFKAKGNVNGATLTSMSSNNANVVGAADTPVAAASLATDVKAMAAGQTLDIDNDALLSGSTLTVDGKTFEFTTAADLSKVKEGNTAVLIGGNKAATSQNLITAMKGQGINGKIDNDGKVLIEYTGATQGTTGGGLTLQIGDTGDDFNKVTVSVDDLSAGGIGTDGLNVSDQKSSNAAIDTIKTAINKVSTNRANLGSLQNRLEHTINNLDTTAENMTAANSRIRDTDMAKEMMNYTKMNVLVQAAQAMLAQANQQPQSILQLLQ